MAKSLVASTDLVKGTVIEPQHLKVLSPGQGLSAQNYEKLLGRTVQRDMLEEDISILQIFRTHELSPRAINLTVHGVCLFAIMILPNITPRLTLMF